jgi:hypothetical protein
MAEGMRYSCFAYGSSSMGSTDPSGHGSTPAEPSRTPIDLPVGLTSVYGGVPTNALLQDRCAALVEASAREHGLAPPKVG